MRKSKIMKALLVFGMSVVTATAMVGITACDNGGNGGGSGSGHKHVWSDWTDNGDGTHSRECTADGHEGEKTQTGQHGTANVDNKCPDCGYQYPAPHSHNWDTAWTYDATNHWHKCLNDGHTGVQDSVGAHTDTDENGKCDTCGYVTDALKVLKAREDKIIDEDFTTAPEIGTWSDATGYGVRGFKTSSANAATVQNGALAMPGSGGQSDLYIDLGAVSGEVEGYFEVKLLGTGGGWTPIQFVGTDAAKTDSEVLGIRIDSSAQAVGYRLDGGNYTAVASPVTYSKDDVWKVYFKLNLETGAIELTINGKAYYVNANSGITDIKGIKLPSSSDGKKYVSIDNVVIADAHIALATYQTKLNAKLDAAVTARQTSHSESLGQLNTICSTAKDNVTAAETHDAAYAAYLAGLAEIKAVPNNEGVALNNAKTAAKTELTNYNTDKTYSEENQALVADAKATGALNIDKAASLEAVAQALADAKAEVDKIPDSSAVACTVTVHYGEATATLNSYVGMKISSEEVLSVIPAAALTGKTVTGYYKDSSNTVFNFDEEVLTAAGCDVYVGLEDFVPQTVSNTVDYSAAIAANDVIFELKDAQGATLAKVTALQAASAKNSATRVEADGTSTSIDAHVQMSNKNCLKIDLAAGYTYKVTIYAGSSASGSRNITINSQQKASGDATACKALTWDLTSGSYSSTESGNIRLARIVIEATPIAS